MISLYLIEERYEKMTKLQSQYELVAILEALHEGINPVSGEKYPSTSVVNQTETVRALGKLIAEMKKPAYPKRAPKKSLAERREINRKEGRPLRSHTDWDDQDEALVSLFTNRNPVEVIALELERSELAIAARLFSKGMISEDVKAHYERRNRG